MKPDSDHRAYMLSRLQKKRPDLHARVLAGEMTLHQASVDAGCRPREISVRAGDANAAARTLLKFYSKSELLKAILETSFPEMKTDANPNLQPSPTNHGCEP